MAQFGFLSSLFGKKTQEPVKASIVRVEETSPVVSDAPPVRSTAYFGGYGNNVTRALKHDGEKFPGGFGATDILQTDYWTLRQRSDTLFRTNLYARGLIRRLVTNEIHSGLHLETTPEEELLGLEEDDLVEWSETVENLFAIWADDPFQCDLEQWRTFGKLQGDIRMEALVAGDVLILNLPDTRTGLPRLRVIGGDAVRTPFPLPKVAAGNEVIEGVELDPYRRHVAYWVRQFDGEFKRFPAWGEKSGRRLAWLYYGTDKRYMDVRGEPVLSLVLQSIKDLDRYRDSAVRKAVINAILAVFVKKTADRPGSGPVAGGALSRRASAASDSDGVQRSFNIADFVPGVVMDELQVGEEPVPFSTHGTDMHYGDFERAVLSAIAWANEIPPEILFLGFGSNYSASQASINEFKLYLTRVRKEFGDAVCRPVFHEWFVSSVYNGEIEAEGALESWRGETKPLVFQCWVHADWSGNIKPAVDLSKLVHGYKEMVASGFITRTRAARELTGTKFARNAQKLFTENSELARAMEPIVQLNLVATTTAADKNTDSSLTEIKGSPQGDVVDKD